MNEMMENTVKNVGLTKIKTFISLLRISHWSKAIFVMLGTIYSPAKGHWGTALIASLAFCFIASAVYIYNDIEDKSSDSLHPRKKEKPIASDLVNVGDAIFMLFFLLFAGLFLGWMVSKNLAFILTVYLVLNLAYTHLLKLIPIFDVACIALGYMLRVLAGTIGIGIPISIWLILTGTLLSLFIALNKLQLELHLGIKHTAREVLRKYNPHMLQVSVFFTGLAAFIVYFLYTVVARSDASLFLLTLPFAALAFWRFSWLCTQNLHEDDPVVVFLSDKLSCFNLLCFAFLTFLALKQ
jgi:4-hydroxybenzoate polyprenyltransferase